MENRFLFHAEKTLQENVNDLLEHQNANWDLASKNYKGLEKVRKHTIQFDHNVKVAVQFNPERIYSSAAKVDAKSISQRKCFLCLENLPSQQKGVPFGEDYVVLVNPFPIFPKHLTIPHRQHIEQRISGRMAPMLELAKELKDYAVFYNGPKCGASAPDHFHFQAGNKNFMLMDKDFDILPKTRVVEKENLHVWSMDNYLRHCLVLDSANKALLCETFEQVLQIITEILPAEDEPMLNIIASYNGNGWRVFIYPRKLHRPWQFFAEADEQIVLSPASVDFGGVLITPREEDHTKLNQNQIKDIFKQVSYTPEDFDKLTQRIAETVQ